eukprot:s103_g42.t2
MLTNKSKLLGEETIVNGVAVPTAAIGALEAIVIGMVVVDDNVDAIIRPLHRVWELLILLHGSDLIFYEVREMKQDEDAFLPAADVVSLGALSDAMGRSQQWELVLEVLQESPSLPALSSCIIAQERVSQWERALPLLAWLIPAADLARAKKLFVSMNSVVDCEDHQRPAEQAERAQRSFSLKKVIADFGVPFVVPELNGQPAAGRDLNAEEGRSMEEKHFIRKCFPCLYLTRKNDGCWKGNACEYCHLCTREEAKRRRNRIQLENRKRLKAQARLQ